MLTANLVREETTTTGTGNLTLSAVLRRFSDVFGSGGSTPEFHYIVYNSNASEFESGFGYMSDANTLVRSIVVESSNSGALVNFSAGTKVVACSESAQLENMRFDGALPVTPTSNDDNFLRQGATTLPTGYTDHNIAASSSTYAENDGWGTLTYPSVAAPGAHAFRYAVKNIPTFSEVVMRCRTVTPHSAGGPYAGLIFREAGGKLITFGPDVNDFIHIGQWSNDTTFSSFPNREQQRRPETEWYRVVANSATSWDFYCGDGRSWWRTLAAHNPQTWLGGAPTEIGWGMSPAIGTTYATCAFSIHCLRFKA